MFLYYHVQFPIPFSYAGDGHSSKDRGGQCQVGVDGCSVLTVTMVSDGRVETWPEDPQEKCTCGVTANIFIHKSIMVKKHNTKT